MKPTSILYLFLLLLLSATTYAQITLNDPVIKKMVTEVKAENLEATIRKLASFGTRHTLSDTKSNTRGIGAAQRWVKSEFDKYALESGGRLSSTIDYFMIKADGKRIAIDSQLGNVMATLKGTDPTDDRVLIISGHLDSRATDVMDAKSDAPGANDDASGVAAMMELTRIMSKREFPFTLIFVAVTGEEQGLYGAKHLADIAKESKWNVIAMINNDMIGNSLSSGTNLRDNTKVRVFSETIPYLETESEAKMRKATNRDNDSPSRQLARYIKTITNQYVDQLDINLVYRNDRFLRGGDHTPFSQNGFTAIRFCERNENYNQQHQNLRTENNIKYGDLPEFMDFDYLRKITCSNLATFTNLAWSPKAPANAGIEVKELTNSSVLVWTAPEGKAVYGYNILIRETAASHWEKTIFVKDIKAEIPYSKDNYFFAIQSTDELGHSSLPVFPLPIR
ncbi:Zn-dependent M28 family amino/carboxypeptidase [Flavobacterium sp. CG_23.5]|uniref:M20/M25/M40 family metallo-hydrolase n=1 Tax=unclassified Flavobacterium TaxID=196869 RepID=UPI0018CBD45F|nr:MULTISPECIES: M20/M25/M40 family metallo-hydrolase [unclassified Flavobacterium]MBG6111578.1 Zn-dependent M28 family amino/carboxypeptidase [Flavobacterium sp. CG_9.10]MBP2282329.1 Zn-dependent M28 family amino/carboxypeptidase [Flavobacterium sp. CG_23.5]